MLVKPQAILIIAPLIASSASYRYWTNAGYKVLAFLPNNIKVNDFFKKDLENTPFDEVITGTGTYEDDIKLILNKQEQYDIVWGYIGLESTVLYGEQLLRTLFPTTSNDPQTSIWRFSKYAMNERLKEVHLPYVKQCRITEQHITNEIQIFLKDVSYPVVVKPSFNSAASDNVFFCDNYDDIIEHIRAIGDHGFFARVSEILVQEKLTGTECIVDLTTLHGKHVVSSVFAYEKRIINSNPVYKSINSIPSSDPLYPELCESAKNMATALGVENGFSHMELMVSATHEIKLIELNLRPSGIGGAINDITFKHQNENQYTIAVNLLHNKIPKIQFDGKFYTILLLNNFGFTYKRIKQELLEKIKSYEGCKILKPECLEKPTQNLLVDSVAYIYLSNFSKTELLNDMQLLDEYERNGVLFEE